MQDENYGMKTEPFKNPLPIIRPQFSWEREELIELSRRAIRAQCPSVYGQEEVEVLTHPQNKYFVLRTPVFGFVYERNGKVLGLSGWEGEEQDGHARVTHCFVEPDAMGEGIGAALLSHCLTDVMSHGYTRITLRATKDAEAFYQKYGFRTVDSHKLPLDEVRHIEGPVMLAPKANNRDSLSKTVIIREARDRDAGGIISLIDHCFSEYEGLILDVENEEPILKQFHSGFAKLGGQSWVATKDERIVACVGYAPSKAGLELKKLYVAKELRGSGLAQHMMNLVIDAALQQGATSVDLWSDVKFERAHRFYEKHGFKRTPHTRALHDLSNTLEYHFLRSPL